MKVTFRPDAGVFLFFCSLYLWISGGSRLILALSSITSFATRPLLWSREMMLRMRFAHTRTHTHIWLVFWFVP